MTQWYYADDSRNRVGPISADELREHFRQRRLRRDSLVWSEGMVQWMPLERLALELDIDSIAQDPTLPPPLPAGHQAGGGAPHAAQPMRPAAPKKGLSGCMIALIVGLVVAVPFVAILAAIAIPAYNDYVQRAKVSEAITAVAPLKLAVAEHLAAKGDCPDEQSADLAALLAQLKQHPRLGGVRVGTLEGGHCAFEITLRGPGALEGKTLLFEADANATNWDCTGGDLPAPLRPRQCRASSVST